MKLKTRIITVILLLSAIGGYAQDNRLFTKLAENKDITTVFISKSILRLAPDMAIGDANISNLISKLDKLEIYTSEKSAATAIMKKEAEAFTKNKAYESLMSVRDGDENIDFLVLTDGTNIKELVMVMKEPRECTIMRIMGNFTMEDIQKVMSDNQQKGKK